MIINIVSIFIYLFFTPTGNAMPPRLDFDSRSGTTYLGQSVPRTVKSAIPSSSSRNRTIPIENSVRRYDKEDPNSVNNTVQRVGVVVTNNNKFVGFLHPTGATIQNKKLKVSGFDEFVTTQDGQPSSFADKTSLEGYDLDFSKLNADIDIRDINSNKLTFLTKVGVPEEQTIVDEVNDFVILDIGNNTMWPVASVNQNSTDNKNYIELLTDLTSTALNYIKNKSKSNAVYRSV